MFGSSLSSALEKSPSSVTLCQETGGLGVAGATPERGQKGVKETPLILTFRQPIEDHVNQNVGSAPAGAVAAERRRSLIPNCSFMSAGATLAATLPSDAPISGGKRAKDNHARGSERRSLALKPPPERMCGLEMCWARGERFLRRAGNKGFPMNAPQEWRRG